MNKTWKTQKKLHVSFQSMFFLCGLHNLGKIRPNHWTLRGSDMPRMLCPARCRKVWIRCLNTFENNKCRWYLWLMTLGWNRSTHSMRYHQVYYVCVRLCPSRLLHIDMLYNLIVGTPFGNWMFLPSKQTAADQQTTKDSSELFFLVSIYIYVCVCVFSWWFHWFHIFSWCCSMFFIICSHDFPIVFPYLPRYFVSGFFHIFFRKKICSNRFFSKRNSFPIFFPRFFHGFPRSHGTWRQHWQRRRHATAQLHGQPRGQPRGQRSQSGGLGAMECLGEDIGVCRGLLNVNWSVKSWLNSG